MSKEETHKGLTRRSFIKRAAVGAGAVTFMGMGTKEAKGETELPTLPVIADKVKMCDILVVGTGFAGLVAALRALEKGASVIAIEMQPKGWWVPGGDLIVSAQALHITGFSLMQPEDVLRKRIAEQTANRAIPEIVDAMVKNAPRGINWLKEQGIEFEEPPGKEFRLKPAKPPRYHWGAIKPGASHDAARYGGKKAADILESRILGKGGQILYGTKFLEFILNNRGEVTGIVAKDRDGLFEIKAGATILATGGFLRNKELLIRYFGPQAGQVKPYTNPGCIGEGLVKALELGAATRSLSYASFSPWAEAAVWNDDFNWLNLVSGQYGITVNESGERLTDESDELTVWGALMLNAGYQSARGFCIIDSKIRSLEKVTSEIALIQEMGATVHSADTIDKLAEKAKISKYLVATVEEFNKAVDEGKTQYLRAPKRHKINRINEPPFYAIPFVLGQISTMGGLLTNSHGKVLNNDGESIPGLFAAGAVAHGTLTGGNIDSPFHGPSYCGHLAHCLIFGILSGENAAARTSKT